MANPQRENGHTAIANEVMEQLYSRDFGARELKVILFVLRKTWGWQKKEDCLSNGQISKATKIHRAHVIKIISELVAKRVLLVAKKVLGKMIVNSIRFNKDYDTWTSPKTATSSQKGTRVVAKKVLELVPKQLPTKEKKETIQKKDTQWVTNHLEEFQEKFPLIDVPFEWEKCQDWYKARNKPIIDWAANFRVWLRSDIKKKPATTRFGRIT